MTRVPQRVCVPYLFHFWSRRAPLCCARNGTCACLCLHSAVCRVLRRLPAWLCAGRVSARAAAWPPGAEAGARAQDAPPGAARRLGALQAARLRAARRLRGVAKLGCSSEAAGRCLTRAPRRKRYRNVFAFTPSGIPAFPPVQRCKALRARSAHSRCCKLLRAAYSGCCSSCSILRMRVSSDKSCSAGRVSRPRMLSEHGRSVRSAALTHQVLVANLHH